MELRPSEIRFKQDSIKSTFQDGGSVNKTAEKLCDGELSVNELPRIKIAKWNNKYYSFDNRRLYVFRVAEYRSAISHIKVNLAPSSMFNEDTFTTENDGREVKVRYGITYPHCKPNWLRAGYDDENSTQFTAINIPESSPRTPNFEIHAKQTETQMSQRNFYDDLESGRRSNNSSWCSCTIL